MHARKSEPEGRWIGWCFNFFQKVHVAYVGGPCGSVGRAWDDQISERNGPRRIFMQRVEGLITGTRRTLKAMMC
jgi:hypothetical protein